REGDAHRRVSADHPRRRVEQDAVDADAATWIDAVEEGANRRGTGGLACRLADAEGDGARGGVGAFRAAAPRHRTRVDDRFQKYEVESRGRGGGNGHAPVASPVGGGGQQKVDGEEDEGRTDGGLDGLRVHR